MKEVLRLSGRPTEVLVYDIGIVTRGPAETFPEEVFRELSEENGEPAPPNFAVHRNSPLLLGRDSHKLFINRRLCRGMHTFSKLSSIFHFHGGLFEKGQQHPRAAASFLMSWNYAS